MVRGFVKKILIYLVSISLLISIIFIVFLFQYINTTLKSTTKISTSQFFDIEPGSSINRIFSQMRESGITDNTNLQLRIALLYFNLIESDSNSFQAGTYIINPQDTTNRIFDMFSSGAVVQGRVTLIEGETSGKFINKLIQDENINIDHFPINSTLISSRDKIIQLVPKDIEKELIERLSIPYDSIEGMFLADTYVYKYGDNAINILKSAHNILMRELDRLWDNRDLSLPYSNKYEPLIMASIIEKETAVDEERKLISSVFINRLNRNMRLQTDPTIIYGIGEDYTGRIRSVDLRTYTPYNTYRINGLPPTPIANVGLASLEAAFYPDDSDYIFFVARGDGYHQFSRTLSEHNAAVRQYQINRRSDYTSVPND